MTQVEFVPSSEPPKRKKRMEVASKVWAFIQGRRTARAIADNKAAVMALASSVAVAGVGAYATVEAKQAQHGVDALAARTYALETDALLVTAQLASLRTNVQRLDRKSAKQLHQLRVDLARAGLAVDRVAAQLAALPPAPSILPLTARVEKMAKALGETSRQALAAAAAAAEQIDPEARRQAELAADAAGVAGEAAKDAQRTADEAKTKVDAIVIPPPYEPFPRYIELLPLNTTVPAGAIAQTFTVDLPAGHYAATLQLTIDTAANVPWYGQMVSAGRPTVTEHVLGPRSLNVGMDFTTGGGTNTFTARFDADVNVGPLPVTGTWRVVIEKR